LVEEAAQITREFYLGLTVDRSRQKNILIFTDEGGVEIEELALSKPSVIHKYEIQSSQDIDAILKDIKGKLNLDGSIFNNLLDISKKLSQIYFELDCQLAEINPLVLTREDKLIALDAKLIIDDNALFRHEGIASLSEVVETDAIEAKAHKKGIAYVRLQGDVGVIGNGAGLVMATMDEVARAGCAPANFLDIGGGAKAELMKNSLEIVLMDPQVKGIFINIFGGITRCDEVAGGIISAFADKKITLPIVIRLQGTRCRQAKELLEGTDFNYIDSMEEGARKIASLVGES
jgi:succinyl-CoA synthetase beta subunit